jgi:uncharacterized protein YpmS
VWEEKMVTKTETAFWTVGFFILVTALVMFTLDMSIPMDSYDVTETSNTLEMMDLGTTYEITHETQETIATKSVSIITDYDPELELGYLFMMGQDVDSVGELNELEERMYDILEDYDEVEMEFFYEQMDNARECVEN